MIPPSDSHAKDQRATSMQSIDCVAYGVPMRLVADTPELFTTLPTLLPHGSEIVADAGPDAQAFSLLSARGPSPFRCFSGAEMLLASLDFVLVRDAFVQALMIHVANCAEKRVFVHAGVVAYHGKALVLPGASFAGKSTLTAALVRAGATYYSDEYAVFDEEGYVYPYARHLSMRTPGQTQQLGVPVSALGGSAGTERLPVALVLFTHYRQGSQLSPESVSSGMAILEMLKHSIPVQRTPARVMSTLAAMMQRATAWSSPRGEAEPTAAALLAWLAESSIATNDGQAGQGIA